MNAKPTFVPSISKWKVQCFRSKTKQVFRPVQVNWEDCYKESPASGDLMASNPTKFTLDGKELVVFDSYNCATNWMKTIGLRLCDDAGNPVTNPPHTFTLEKEFTSDEKKQ